MKTFVVSIPKSGTYLIRELLDHIGLGSSYLHISKRGTYDYTKISYDEGRLHPQKCLTSMPLTQSLANIPSEGFAVGHLKYSHENIKALKDFNIIFIGRAVKETVLSYMIYGIETGRCHRKQIDQCWVTERNPQKQFLEYIALRADRIIQTYKNILPWRDHPNVSCFDFNELRSDTIEQTQRLANAVNYNLSIDQIQNIVSASLNKKTQTKSSIANKNKFWSNKAHTQLDKLIIKHQIEYGNNNEY